jgi:hypothetical protein
LKRSIANIGDALLDLGVGEREVDFLVIGRLFALENPADIDADLAILVDSIRSETTPKPEKKFFASEWGRPDMTSIGRAVLGFPATALTPVLSRTAP